MIGELLGALGEAVASISVWPDRKDGAWKWIYWGFATIVPLVLIGIIVVVLR